MSTRWSTFSYRLNTESLQEVAESYLLTQLTPTIPLFPLRVFQDHIFDRQGPRLDLVL